MSLYDTPAQARKKALEAAKKLLEDQRTAIIRQLDQNRWTMAKLVNQSTALKRELALLSELSRALMPRPVRGGVE